MDRFVALVWDDRSAPLKDRAAALAETLLKGAGTWASVLDAPGLKLFVLKRAAGKAFVTPMASIAGAVVGPVFRRGEEAKGRVTELPDADASKIAATRGDTLLRDFWGSYVAFWRSADGSCGILRDPSGALPCYRTNSAGVEILCSFVADIASLPGVHFSIDRTYIAAFLSGRRAVTGQTGLRELTELLPGERITIHPPRPPVGDWAWNAPDLASRPRRQAAEDAVHEAREIAERCFSAWGRLSDNVVVRLSGGLDSSAVAAMLRRHSTGRVTALHIVGKGYEAHELTFARMSAKTAGLELLEIDEGLQPTDYRPLLANETVQPRPTRQIFGATADSLLAEVYSALGADTAMSGHGGDVVFFQRSLSGSVSTDDLLLNGPTADFWRRLYDTATLLERSIWATAGDAFASIVPTGRRRAARVAPSMSAELGKLFGDGAIQASLDKLQHPLSNKTNGLPPAKAAHVKGLHGLRNYHALRLDTSVVDEIHPLMAQPIIEFALVTPAYLFSTGGMDRALERQAFQHLLPPEVFRRTSKGFVSHELTSLFTQNLPYFRELVLEGDLTRLFEIDGSKLERLLTTDYLQEERGLADVMSLVATQVWLSTWASLHRAPS